LRHKTLRRAFAGFILPISLFSTACLADTWIQNLTPVQVVTGSDANGQYVQLLVSQTPSNPAGCANADSYVSRTLPPSTLAIALSAFTTGNSLRIFLLAGSCDALLARPTFTLLGIQ